MIYQNFQIFAIIALWTTFNFQIQVVTNPIAKTEASKTYIIDYPFRVGQRICNQTHGPMMSADVTSDAQFFVATAVLSILYCVFISVVYAAIDEMYTSKPEIPLAVSLILSFDSRITK